MGDFTPSTAANQGTNIPPPTGAEPVIRILVTGFGPFHIEFPINSSWSIATALPKELPAKPGCPRIQISVPPEPIEVAYHTVVEWTEQRLAAQDYDLVLHIGLAASRQCFSLETQSSRLSYGEKKDVLGRVFTDAESDALWPPQLFPAVLKPTFDCDDVWRRWCTHVTESTVDLQLSDDPRNYLCGFIYYASMSWFWRRLREERPVVFLHVPDLPNPEDVATGRDVAIGLIRALVESRATKGVFDPLQPGAVVGDLQPVVALETPVQLPSALQVPVPVGTVVEDEMSLTYRR